MSKDSRYFKHFYRLKIITDIVKGHRTNLYYTKASQDRYSGGTIKGRLALHERLSRQKLFADGIYAPGPGWNILLSSSLTLLRCSNRLELGRASRNWSGW